MKWTRQLVFCLLAAAAFSAAAQNQPPFPPIVPGQTVTNGIPPMPKLQSPVAFFRQLLAMSLAERIAALTNRPPESRARIMAKVREYQALDPDEREVRLCATELRWYLTPLMRLAPADRQTRMEQVPDDLREIVQSRLSQWDLLPPPLQQELLANDQTLHYFASVELAGKTNAAPGTQAISEQFNRFFELTPSEKKKTLATLSAAERAAMEKTLQTFEKLPPSQRLLCIRNYAKFAGMSAAERAEFLKNAETWSKLSPKERQTWRDLVAHVPIMPPMPPASAPANLIPRVPPQKARANMATN
jgi:hypothetical protein